MGGPRIPPRALDVSRLPPFVAVRGPCDLRCAWCNHSGQQVIVAANERERAMGELDALARESLAQVGFGLYFSEPTTHDDFLPIVRHAAQLGFQRITLSTSGVELARAEYADELVEAGLTAALISVTGLDPEVSDLLLGRTGATEAKLRALGNCLDRELETTALLMFLRPTLLQVAETARRLAGLEGRTGLGLKVTGCFMDMIDCIDAQRYSLLWPRYDELIWAASQVRAVLADFELGATSLPLCVAQHILGLQPMEARGRNRGIEMVKPADSCAECELSPRCEGIPALALQVMPDGPLLRDPQGVEPPPPDLDALKTLTRATPHQPWQHRLAQFLERCSKRPQLLLGFSITTLTITERGLMVELAKEDQQLVALIDRAESSSQHFLRGSRFAVSFKSDTPADTEEKRTLLERVLALAERSATE